MLWLIPLVTLKVFEMNQTFEVTTMSDAKKETAAQSQEQLSDQQLEQVAGGVDFDQLRRENLDKDAVDFDQLRRENLDKDAVADPGQ